MLEDCFHLGIKAIIRNGEGKILLLKVNPKQLKEFNDKPYWDIPGGRVHKGNTTEETLRREVEEETGITSIKSCTPFSMVLSNIRIPIEDDSVGLILSSYLCDVDNIGEIKISDEHIEFDWFTPQKAKELLSVKYPKGFVEKLSGLE